MLSPSEQVGMGYIDANSDHSDSYFTHLNKKDNC